MNEKYVAYHMESTFKCDTADQLKKDCSTKSINLRFGGYMYHGSRHLSEKIRIATWNNDAIIHQFVENESV